MGELLMFPVRADIFFSVEIGSGVHAASCSKDAGVKR